MTATEPSIVLPYRPSLSRLVRISSKYDVGEDCLLRGVSHNTADSVVRPRVHRFLYEYEIVLAVVQIKHIH